MGAKRSGPASGSDARNINEDNLRRNDDYHRQKKEREDGEWRRSDVVTSNANRRVYNGSERSQQRLQQQRGSSGFSDALKDQWQSGKIFSKRGGGGGGQRGGGRRRSDPWWMSDEERNNPRILPIYRPWWLESNVLVDASWKVAELRREALRRADGNGRVGAAGVAPGYTAEQVNGMKKAELVELLVGLTHTYNLASDGFTPITFIDSRSSRNGDGDGDGGAVPPCYPQVYEGSHDKMMALVTEAYDQILNNGDS